MRLNEYEIRKDQVERDALLLTGLANIWPEPIKGHMLSLVNSLTMFNEAALEDYKPKKKRKK